MLEMRTNCEACDKALSDDMRDVFICSYECTFCAACNETDLKGICPNCGGELTHRPLRIKKP